MDGCGRRAFQLSTGKQLSRSPLLTCANTYTAANPTTWQFDDVLLLRGDSVWYTLSLPQLMLVQQGQNASDDAAQRAHNWLVDADGSYVALDYSDMHGYPPFTKMTDAVAPAQQHGHAKVREADENTLCEDGVLAHCQEAPLLIVSAPLKNGIMFTGASTEDMSLLIDRHRYLAVTIPKFV